MIFAEHIKIFRIDDDGVNVMQVFNKAYYRQTRGVILVDDRDGNTHQFNLTNVARVSIAFTPNNFEPFKL